MKPKKIFAQKLLLELLPFFMLSVFLFLCVFLIGHFKSYTISPPLENTVTTDADSAASLSVTQIITENIPFITDIRIVAEHKNGIGVFDSSGNLLEVHSLDITRLTHVDRQTLKEGMTFDSEGEMRNFLESLDS